MQANTLSLIHLQILQHSHYIIEKRFLVAFCNAFDFTWHLYNSTPLLLEIGTEYKKNILNTKLWNITGSKTKGGQKENLLRDRKGPKSSYLIIYLGREGYLLSATCEANIENTILAITFDGQLKLNFVWNVHVIFFSFIFTFASHFCA